MLQPTEIRRPATTERLPELLAFLDHAAAAAGLADDTAFALHLAVEEACANVITHAYAGREPGPLHLTFHADAHRAAVTLEDEAPHFDPCDVPEPNLTAGAEERPIGGLGWHLIRELMDEVHYQALDGRGNRLTLVKRR